MKALVTGVAGFIGSHLAEALVADGHDVLGVDCLTDYYEPTRKRSNLAALVDRPNFQFDECDLLAIPLDQLLTDVNVVFHLAAQPGVRSSWEENFELYERSNVLATQRLLEAARDSDIERFVYSSSSSVYGNIEGDAYEDAVCHPRSPYGVTKLAAEHLCSLYADNFGVPTVSLRYFTIYGPRQRPDMACSRLIAAAIAGETFSVYGSGEQSRDFTYVSDVVAANLAAAATLDVTPGLVVNIAGGSRASLNEVIDLVAAEVGRRPEIAFRPVEPGDVVRTAASTHRAQEFLGWTPRVGLVEGVQSQTAWVRQLAA